MAFHPEDDRFSRYLPGLIKPMVGCAFVAMVIYGTVAPWLGMSTENKPVLIAALAGALIGIGLVFHQKGRHD